MAYDQVAEIATRLVGPMPLAVQVKKKKRLRKVGSRGLKKTVETIEIDVVCVDDGSPERVKGVSIQRAKAEAGIFGGAKIPAKIEAQGSCRMGSIWSNGVSLSLLSQTSKESEFPKANLEKALLLLPTKEDELGEWGREMEVR
ncbi:uncharacterized protein A4U43_C10F15090 [Asparagus officinalis]|uniref:Uncharacterized protein n=1 Tax=Asparagus officinalis TaxID=4686 RepID=A0A5P1E355_ASPOF|nr:uncharacterized protein A4U43_C10F15090 [Asparagus officinalis]